MDRQITADAMLAQQSGYSAVGSATPSRWGRFRSRIFGRYERAFIALAILVAIECAIASYVGVTYLGEGPFAVFDINLFRASLPLWFAIPLGWSGMVTIALIRRRNDQPLRTFGRIIRYRSDWLIRGLLLFFCYLPLARAFGFVKVSIPFINPFYLDPVLIDLDRAVLGADAWQITHGMLPVGATYFIDRSYAIWFTLVYLITGWSSFNTRPDIQIRSAIALNLTWFLLGAIAATLLSSVGPIFVENFYQDRQFAPMVQALTSAPVDGGLLSIRARDYLLEHFGTGQVGAGISAMPSLHVSMCMLAILMAMNKRTNRWLRAAVIVYGGLILVGSVHLGWHYLSDGVVGAVLTIGIWLLAGLIVKKVTRPSPVEPVDEVRHGVARS